MQDSLRFLDDVALTFSLNKNGLKLDIVTSQRILELHGNYKTYLFVDLKNFLLPLS